MSILSESNSIRCHGTSFTALSHRMPVVPENIAQIQLWEAYATETRQQFIGSVQSIAIQVIHSVGLWYGHFDSGFSIGKQLVTNSIRNAITGNETTWCYSCGYLAIESLHSARSSLYQGWIALSTQYIECIVKFSFHRSSSYFDLVFFVALDLT